LVGGGSEAAHVVDEGAVVDEHGEQDASLAYERSMDATTLFVRFE
jgi:hypothetical protein